MKFKKILLKVTALLTALSITATTASAASTNWSSADGSGFVSGGSNNVWNTGNEGLRITVYDAETEEKVFNTIDITGSESFVNTINTSGVQYFADGSELISKTTWLSYVKTTYKGANASDRERFFKSVASRENSGDGYRVERISELSNITIVSANNTANLAAIKALVGDSVFLKELCDKMDGLEYEDFENGKYKIAFEPIVLLKYSGQDWVLSATECGLLNWYMKLKFSAIWNSTNNLRALMGTLTHSELPRAAFLENSDLGIKTYESYDDKYYDYTHTDRQTGEIDYFEYNNDKCIICCMGIGIVSATGDPDDDDDELPDGTDTAEYHTDTDVYTSFTIENIGDTPFIGEVTFNINSDVKDEVYDFMPEFSVNLSKATIASGFDGNSLILYDESEINEAESIMKSTAAKLRTIKSESEFDEYISDYDTDLSFSDIGEAAFKNDIDIDGITDYSQSLKTFFI